MPSATNLYNTGKILNAADLASNPNIGLNKRVPAFIYQAQAELIGQGADQDTKIVLDLVSKQGQAWPKRWPLNKTNTMALVAAYGDDYGTWPGKAIEIWAENVMFSGKIVPGLRLAAASNGVAPVPTQATPPPSATAVAGMPPAAAPTWNAPRSAATTPLEDDAIPF